MKVYRTNSPEAMARVLAMTMLTDAKLDDRELAAMERLKIYDLLGVSKLEFSTIVSDYCSDLVRSGTKNHMINLMDTERVNVVADAVDDPKKRLELARIMLNLVKADGEFADTELVLLRHLLNRWGLSLDDLAASR